MKRFCILILYLFLVLLPSYCASDPSEQTYVMTPEVTAMTKYGSYPISYYTGTPNISIPIYTIKNQDVEIPIKLAYDASGFKPNQNDGLCGQSWRLMCCGAVTRQVRGLPDDNVTIFGGYQYDGYLKVARSGNAESKDFLLNTQNYVNSQYWLKMNLRNSNGAWTYYHYSPDLFTVLLPNGSSFQFLIDNSGTVRTVGGRACSVDLSHLVIQSYNDTIHTSTIYITDENGYVYEFGGDLKYLEVCYPVKFPETNVPYNTDIQMDIHNGTINAWYLVSIKSPEGYEVARYNYMNTPVDFNSDAAYIQKHFSHYEERASNFGNSNYKTLFFTKMAIPIRLDVGCMNVSFSYEDAGTYIYGTDTDRLSTYSVNPSNYRNPFNHSTFLLKQIEISDNVKRFVTRFRYEEVDNNCGISGTISGKRQFLYGVVINDDVYSLRYNLSQIPHPLTKQLDMQMYYNGNQSITSLLPRNVYATWTSVFSLDFSHRATNPAMAEVGMLTSMKNPTGGVSYFEYEQHRFGKTVERRRDGQIGEVIRDSIGYVGGVRIKSIRSGYEHRVFVYENEDGTSSGIYHNDGIYGYYANVLIPDIYGNQSTTSYKVAINSLAINYDISENYIAYSTVTEKLPVTSSPEQAINKKMTFTSRLTNPDVFTLGGNNIFLSTDYVTNRIAFLSELNQMIIPSSKSIERGLLTGEYYYDISGEMVRSVKYAYHYDPSLLDKYVVSADVVCSNGSIGAANAHATYLYDYNIMTKTIKTKNSGRWIEEKYTCCRDGLLGASPHNMPTKEMFNLSGGHLRYIEYKRPLDYLSTGITYTGVISDMKHKNIVSPIIENSEYLCIDSILSESSIRYLIRSRIVEYQNVNLCQVPQPRNLYVSKLSEPLNASAYSPSYINSNGNIDFQRGLFKCIKTFDLYNYDGRLLQMTDDRGLTTTFIWSHNYQYLLARVNGEDFATVARNWPYGQTELMVEEGRAYPLPGFVNRVNNLRADSILHITTYEYQPLYGVSSITDHSGVTTFYDYNSRGELEYEYRIDEHGNKNYLKAYRYSKAGGEIYE